VYINLILLYRFPRFVISCQLVVRLLSVSNLLPRNAAELFDAVWPVSVGRFNLL